MLFCKPSQDASQKVTRITCTRTHRPLFGEIRDRTFENQRYRASGLNLVVSAVILWNTVYLSHAVAELGANGERFRDDLLAHIAPLGWEHITFNGDYVWPTEPLQNAFRPLRNPRSELLDAA